MALRLSRTDNKTKAVYPVAYGRIDKASGTLEEDRLIATLNWYFDQTAAGNGGSPVTDPDIITLTGAEITSFRTGCLTLLYGLIKQRDEYSGAVDV